VLTLTGKTSELFTDWQKSSGETYFPVSDISNTDKFNQLFTPITFAWDLT